MGKAATIALVSLAAGVLGGGSVASDDVETDLRQTASRLLSGPSVASVAAGVASGVLTKAPARASGSSVAAT